MQTAFTISRQRFESLYLDSAIIHAMWQGASRLLTAQPYRGNRFYSVPFLGQGRFPSASIQAETHSGMTGSQPGNP